MKIIILGAGQVGSTLAEHLAFEKNNITIIDHDNERLLRLQERLDIRAIPGHASYPNLLYQAGADEADMLIALTNSDEVNMVACQISHTLFQIPIKIARIRSLQYLSQDNLFDISALPIDVLISPEQLVTNHIKRLIEYPDALQILDFTNSSIKLVAVTALYGGSLIGHSLRYLKEHLPNIEAYILGVFRDKNFMDMRNEIEIKVNDEVFFVAPNEYVKPMMSELRKLDTPNKKVILVGGGNIGTRLALSLENNFYVKIIEHNPRQIEFLATQLDKSVVLQGDASDKDLLINENIDHTDIFCSVTNSDETNIMSAILAKRLGAKKVMALINRSVYHDVVAGSGIDITISPHLATVGSLLTHIRRGDVVKVHPLRQGKSEAIEVITHGTKENSKVIGRRIDKIELPKGVVIAAVIRNQSVLLGDEDIIIADNDHLIIFVADAKNIKEVEKIFLPTATEIT